MSEMTIYNVIKTFLSKTVRREFNTRGCEMSKYGPDDDTNE